MSTETQIGATDVFEQQQRRRLVKSMRLFDLVFFGITTVVSLDTIGQISSFGAETFTWLLVLVVLFVIPYAWLMAELTGAFPQEGGPYHWMRLAFGRGWAALGAVLYWITNPLWLGGSLSFLASATFSAYIAHLDTGSVGDYMFKLAFVWVGILVAVISLRRGKWIPSIGAFVKLTLVGFVSLTVVIYAFSHGVHGYGIGSFSPTLVGFLGAVPVLLFAISGFECGSAAGDEMTNARRDGPLFITRSATISVGCYLIPILAVLLVVPVKRITGVSGFMDAVSLTFSIYGSARHALVDIVAVAFVFTLLTQGSAWMMGSDRVLAAAGMDGTFPRWLGVFHPRLGTPVRVNLISGAVATVFVVVANTLTSGSAANTFAVVLTVAISTVLMSYLIIYPSAWALRRKQPNAIRPFVVPFGDRGMGVATVLATFFALLGTWVALFPGVLESLFGLSYDFSGTWGVSRGRFEALTLGTVAVIVALTLAGLWLGTQERRRESGAVSATRDVDIGPA
ncbi:MAG: APC family permease [Solirubrobacteraceae bacterium]